MIDLHRVAPFAAAAVLVAAAAWLPGVEAAEAAGGRSANDHTRQLDPERPIDARKGPFFGLRVNSMDVTGEARTLACYEYTCPGLLPGEEPQAYQFVRHAFRRSLVRPLACDEILPLAFVGHDVRYSADVLTSRWIRRRGPSGTPIGGFVGKLYVNATLEVADGDAERTVTIPFMDLNLIGTTGMRPGRSTGSDDPDAVDDRCDAPLHDEGWYQGRFHVPGLRKIEKLVRPDSAAHIRILRRLAGSVIAGSFEGRLVLAGSTTDESDHCDLAGARWWFDGLLGHRCRGVSPDPRVEQRREPAVDRFDGIR